MSTSDQQNSPSINDSIRPAQVTLNVGPTTAAGSDSSQKSLWQEHRYTLFGIGIGLVLLVAVIFVLPNKVSVEVDPVEDAPIAEAPVIKGPTESPWQEQQFGKERREAQEILAKLLDKQKQLEEIQVWIWAEEEYDQAKATAENADRLYRSREFVQAQLEYQSTLDQFNSLLEKSASLYQQSLEEGEQAIVDGNDVLATEKFNLAAIIQPEQDAPKLGLQRAAVLEKLIEQVNAGQELQREGNLQEAKQRYQAALDLDETSLLAQSRIENINTAIRDSNFSQQMSAGYAAINAKQYTKAINAFDQATKIKPSAADAREALTQAKNEKTLSDIELLTTEAKKLEQNEQWHQANENFSKALELDSNLVDARVGVIRTKARAEVDDKLEGIIEEPQRLTTASVHREFTEYLASSKAIPNPGPRLKGQLEQLEIALQKAVQPVQVQLRSDTLTAVTVYRVGKLGQFAEKQLTLAPGTYTAVGTRNGYRDVRQEFTVSLDSNQSVVTIQCVEKISKG